MRSKTVLSFIHSFYFLAATASVTVYNTPGQAALGATTATTSADLSTYTGSGLGAYDPTVLNPPAVPDPAPPTSFNIQLLSTGTTGLSIPLDGNFLGFSIEFSVITQVSECDLMAF